MKQYNNNSFSSDLFFGMQLRQKKIFCWLPFKMHNPKLIAVQVRARVMFLALHDYFYGWVTNPIETGVKNADNCLNLLSLQGLRDQQGLSRLQNCHHLWPAVVVRVQDWVTHWITRLRNGKDNNTARAGENIGTLSENDVFLLWKLCDSFTNCYWGKRIQKQPVSC